MSLLPMLMNQYGGLKGVQEITGLINLLNPIGIMSVVVFLLGVWVPFKKDIIGKILGGIGVIGIAAARQNVIRRVHTKRFIGGFAHHPVRG